MIQLFERMRATNSWSSALRFRKTTLGWKIFGATSCSERTRLYFIFVASIKFLFRCNPVTDASRTGAWPRPIVWGPPLVAYDSEFTLRCELSWSFVKIFAVSNLERYFKTGTQPTTHSF